MHPTKTPPDGHAEFHVVAASPEVGRRVAHAVRRHFTATEPRGCPAGVDDGTRLGISVATTRTALAGDQTARGRRPPALVAAAGNGPPSPFGE